MQALSSRVRRAFAFRLALVPRRILNCGPLCGRLVPNYAVRLSLARTLWMLLNVSEGFRSAPYCGVELAKPKGQTASTGP